MLQLAVGPVFFYVVNLSIQRTWLDGLAAAAAVTVVDLFYISLAIVGVGALFQSRRMRRAFGVLGAIALIAFGALMLRNAVDGAVPTSVVTHSASLASSFASVFALTLFNPMTILFFTGLFSAKAAEHDFSKTELRVFGLGTGSATMTFMGATALLASLVGGSVPPVAVALLNAAVGCLLLAYGSMRLLASVRRTP